MKRGSYMSNFGSKGQRSTFRRLSGCTHFLTGYLNTSWLVFIPALNTASGWWKKDAQKVLGQTAIKGCCRKALDDFADLSVLCQLRLFTYAFCYQFLMILLLWNIPSRSYLFFQLYDTLKQSYRAGRANRSNRPTKVSHHWTGFKFGICP